MARQSTIDFYRQKAANAGAARREADPTNWANQRRDFLIDQRQKRMDDFTAARELEKQRLANKGQLDVEDLRQTGATTRTGMTEGGALKRLGMTESGLNQRFGQELQQRRNESDEDFWLRREELEKQNKQFQATHSLARDRLGYEQGAAEDTNRLRLFEHLNQTNPLTGQSNFELNRDRYNLFSMTPEAQAALNERILGNLDVAGDARVTTSGVARPDISGEVGRRQYTDAQNAANLASIRPGYTSSKDQSVFQELVQRRQNQDPLRPLKSVLTPLNQAVGSTADSLVNKYQRDSYFR